MDGMIVLCMTYFVHPYPLSVLAIVSVGARGRAGRRFALANQPESDNHSGHHSGEEQAVTQTGIAGRLVTQG